MQYKVLRIVFFARELRGDTAASAAERDKRVQHAYDVGELFSAPSNSSPLNQSAVAVL